MPARPRIAVALEYPLAQKGGTQAIVRGLLIGLSPDFDIVLVSGDKDRSALPLEFSRLISAHFHWEVPANSAEPAKKLADDLRNQNLQLAHFHFGGTYGWTSNRFWRCPIYYFAKSGVPCVSSNHLATDWLDCGVNPRRPVWQKQLYQLFAIFSRSQIYRRLKFEICDSVYDQKRLQRQFPFFKYKIIPVYHSFLEPAETVPPVENRQPIILNVGHVARRKGQFVLAEAFCKIAARYPDWKLQFAGGDGDGIETQRISRLAHEAGLEGRIELLGERNDPIDLMRRAAIYVQPSFTEALGLALQEALFYGCPAIGTRVGGIPELIDDGKNGLLVKPGNVDELAGVLAKMISDGSLRTQCAARARASVLDKGMTFGKMVEKYRVLCGNSLKSRDA